jgi:hypothetical protein
MSADSLIEKFGIYGLVIFGLAWAWIIVWKRLQEVQDARLTEMREHNRQIIEITKEIKDLGHGSIKAMDSLSDVVKESIRHG